VAKTVGELLTERSGDASVQGGMGTRNPDFAIFAGACGGRGKARELLSR
jgi:hypothetical protein